MTILFCESSIDRNKPDEAFWEEYESAVKNGFSVLLFNFDNITTENIKAIKTIEKIIYRGWMLKPFQYAKLFNELLAKNYILVNNPVEYQNCHYLPDSLQFINNCTPKTIYQKIDNKESIGLLLKKAEVFEGKPVIIKDYVKSEKHYWKTACFVENSNDTEKLRESIKRFINLRENAYNEGIVLREFVELENLAIHSKSGMPLSVEFRLFFFNNELLDIFDYWEEGEYKIEKPDINFFIDLAKSIKSNFFTMDIAKKKDGAYLIMELGDGQVAGIPEKTDKFEFYKKLVGLTV